jgi:hypothetical protein
MHIHPAPEAAQDTQGLMGFFGKPQVFHTFFCQGTGRADVHAGSTELAAGPEQRHVHGGPDYCGGPPLDECQNGESSHLSADPHAAPAEYAEVVVPVKKGIAAPDFQVSVNRRVPHPLQTDLGHYILKLAPPIVGAQYTAGDLAHLADCGLEVITVLFFRADQTGVGMFAQYELQDLPAQPEELRGSGLDLQAIVALGAAGGKKPAAAFDLDQAQAAAGKRYQAGMVTQRGYADAVLPRRLQYGFFPYELE